MTASLPMDVCCHGGTDALGAAPWDFSTNSNAAGPCPGVRERLAAVDPTRYPDPAYAALRARMARFHAVDESRIVIGASGTTVSGWPESAWASMRSRSRATADRGSSPIVGGVRRRSPMPSAPRNTGGWCGRWLSPWRGRSLAEWQLVQRGLRRTFPISPKIAAEAA